MKIMTSNGNGIVYLKTEKEIDEIRDLIFNRIFMFCYLYGDDAYVSSI